MILLLVLGWIALGTYVFLWLIPRSEMSEGQNFAAMVLSMLIYFGVPLALAGGQG